MKLFRNKLLNDLIQLPARRLDRWLDVATDGLSSSARKRITLEITAHFKDAVEARISEGFDEPVAREQALLDLGDPARAAKRFRKEHLTERDVELIAHHSGKTLARANVIMAFVWCAMFAGMMFFDWREYAGHRIRFLALVVTAIAYFAVVTTYCFFALPNNPRRNVSVVLSLSILMNLCQAIFLSFAMALNGHWLWPVYPVAYGLSRCVPEMGLWLKLRKMADVWQEVPPAV